jgi:hypothetical protein
MTTRSWRFRNSRSSSATNGRVNGFKGGKSPARTCFEFRDIRSRRAAPVPDPVEPILSTKRSSASSKRCRGKTTLAQLSMISRLGSMLSSLISDSSISGSIKLPAGKTMAALDASEAAGSWRKTQALPLGSIPVCPEFGPPTRTTAHAPDCCAMWSATFPFPSEPYCPPTTTLTGIHLTPSAQTAPHAYYGASRLL